MQVSDEKYALLQKVNGCHDLGLPLVARCYYGIFAGQECQVLFNK